MITRVEYISDYILKIHFYDGSVKKIDFGPFLESAMNPMTSKYRDLRLFKKVEISYGHLSWNKGEMEFSAESLYDCSGQLA